MLSPAAIVPTPTAANAALRACDRPCCQSMLLTPGDPIGEEGPIGGPYPAAAIGAPPPPPPPPPGAPPPPYPGGNTPCEIRDARISGVIVVQDSPGGKGVPLFPPVVALASTPAALNPAPPPTPRVPPNIAFVPPPPALPTGVPSAVAALRSSSVNCLALAMRASSARSASSLPRLISIFSAIYF